MNREDDPLPTDVQAFFDAERARPTLPADAVRALRVATESALQDVAAPPRSFLQGVGGALGGAALGLVVGVSGALWLRPARVVRVVETRVVIREVAPPPVAAAYVDAGTPSVSGADASRSDAAISPERWARPRAPSVGDAIAREQLLLQRARSALLHQDGSAALEALSLHARQFPAGAMVEEREALRVVALVHAAREGEARARAADFHRRWPTSLLGEMVNRAIAGGGGGRE